MCVCGVFWEKILKIGSIMETAERLRRIVEE